MLNLQGVVVLEIVLKCMIYWGGGGGEEGRMGRGGGGRREGEREDGEGGGEFILTHTQPVSQAIFSEACARNVAITKKMS